MKRVSKIMLAIGSALVCISAANASSTTFLGPTAKGRYTSPITDTTAFSVAGEAGIQNFRVGGTVGWTIDPRQRLKFSLEYLWQEINYSFFSGSTNQWVNQGAIGAAYQYLLYDYAFRPSFDVSAFYSHAPSKSLHNVNGVLVNQFGIYQNFVNLRRIAGSNAGGIAPGVTVQPWVGGKAGVELNYDDVRYDTHLGVNRDANGFGGTVKLSQMVVENVEVSGSAAVRQPFNNYTANLAWTNVPYFGNWTLALYGAYTAGKNALPSTYDAGVSADYFFNPIVPSKVNEGPSPFVDWTADPAVYIPQVLAVPDQAVVIQPVPPIVVCTQGFPALLGTFPNLTFLSLTTHTINIAPFFTGSGLVFSIVASVPTVGTSTITINPLTGVITATGLRSTTFVTVTASNLCGRVSSNTFTITFAPPDD